MKGPDINESPGGIIEVAREMGTHQQVLAKLRIADTHGAQFFQQRSHRLGTRQQVLHFLEKSCQCVVHKVLGRLIENTSSCFLSSSQPSMNSFLKLGVMNLVRRIAPRVTRKFNFPGPSRLTPVTLSALAR